MRRLLLLLPWLLLLFACDRPRVLVVGLDSASWAVMDPLMQAGHLPAMRSVVEGGVRGEHDCVPAMPSLPCFCPPVWVSLATGHSVDQHHIIREGTSSTSRGVKAVWEVLHEVGGTSTAVSMRNTWPPEESLDYVMTEAGMDYAASEWFELWPPELPITAWVEELRTGPPDLFQRLGVLPVAEKGPPVWGMIARDRVAMEALSRLLRTDRTDLTWIVLHAPDKVAHLLWSTVQPRADAPVDPERVVSLAELYGGPVTGGPPWSWGTVAAQYQEIDAWLGALLSEFPFDYVVFVSDHGMTRNEGEGLSGLHSPGFVEAHRGIFAIRGPGVRRGADIGRVDVRDVAPTLAYLLELPVGDDLPGRVVEEAFTRAQLRRRPVWTVPSWEGDLAGWTRPDHRGPPGWWPGARRPPGLPQPGGRAGQPSVGAG